MQRLQATPLLPVTPKQRGMIGEDRTFATQQAQLKGRCLHSAPAEKHFTQSYSFLTSRCHADADVQSSAWAADAVTTFATETARSGNHVCRPDVCHKGRLGKQGFCRMFFWHWQRIPSKKDQCVARRAHGVELRERWNGTGYHPRSIHNQTFLFHSKESNT